MRPIPSEAVPSPVDVDPTAVEIVAPPATGAGPYLVLCDHASNALPPRYGTLGLPSSELDRHIAYDIGAAGVTRALCRRLGCAGLLSRWSRLLIDLNRGLDDPTLVMRLSDGAVIPGNRHVDAAERQRRIDLAYVPYHRAITATIDAHLTVGVTPALVSIHSFTPVWRGVPRPWHVGVLWDGDQRLARPLIERLRADPGLVVGDNEPYSGQFVGDTMWRHGTSRGLAHALIEVRQDLIADACGQEAWAERLAAVLNSSP
jgi:predicted N-formylglutamate amidohydrolase